MCATAALLHHVGQFVHQEPLAGVSLRCILVGAKDDMATDGVGVGVHRFGRVGSLGPRVNADGAEVVAEPLLHKGTEVRIQCAAATSNSSLHAWREATA